MAAMSITGVLASSTLSKKSKTANLPPPPPPPPTIDEAAMREDQARRYARRRGIRKNITNASTTLANTNTKQLLAGG